VALASPRVIGRNMLRDERQRSGIAVQGNVQAIRLDPWTAPGISISAKLHWHRSRISWTAGQLT